MLTLSLIYGIILILRIKECDYHMTIGCISSVGLYPEKQNYVDTDVTIVLQTQDVDNWQPYAAAGTNCKVYDLAFTDIPNSGISLDSDVVVIPRGTITDTMLSNFSYINAVETVTHDDANYVRFYSMRGNPPGNIEITLRVLNP